MGAQVAPVFDQDESRLARSVIGLHEGDSDSGPLETVRIECRHARERRKALAHEAAEGRIERVDHSGGYPAVSYDAILAVARRKRPRPRAEEQL